MLGASDRVADKISTGYWAGEGVDGQLDVNHRTGYISGVFTAKTAAWQGT
jgi:hypothetical protein